MASLFAATLSFATHAQALPDGATLGMTEPQLQAAIPGLRHVPRPARLAGGLVGRFSGEAVRIADITLTPTFFIADGQVRRIEYLAAPGSAPAAFDALVAWGRAAWGAELASQSPEGDYATWSRDDVDAYVQRTRGAAGPQVRLVLKAVVAKDAGTL